MPTRYFCDWHGGEITPTSAYYVFELRVTNNDRDYSQEPTVSLSVKGSNYPKSETISTHDNMVCSNCAGKLRQFIQEIINDKAELVVKDE